MMFVIFVYCVLDLLAIEAVAARHIKAKNRHQQDHIAGHFESHKILIPSKLLNRTMISGYKYLVQTMPNI